MLLQVLSEYVGGGHLGQCLQGSEPIQLSALRRYAHQILEALAYLHSNDVVHEDLKVIVCA